MIEKSYNKSAFSRPGFKAGAFLNINKPKGWSSTDVVRKLKGITRAKKVGHGGTLDPMATGVLPICVGSATRFADTVLLGTKSYRITVELGSSTNTFDSTGVITAEADFGDITKQNVLDSLKKFHGRFEQMPPMFSALHHKGKRLYELARQGMEVERPPRQVETFRLELVDFDLPNVVIEVECSHGFYARSLANDVGEDLGTYAHLSELIRTHAGVFNIKDAISIDEVQLAARQGDWQKVAMPIDTTLRHLDKVELTKEQIEIVRNGRHLAVDAPRAFADYESGDNVRAYSSERELIAILVYEPGKLGWRPEKVLSDM